MAMFLALVTFNLDGIAKAPPARRAAVHKRISTGLAKLKLLRVIHSKKGRNRIELPDNFYSGEFEKGDPFNTSTELREHLARKVKKVIRAAYPDATIFLAVSRRWTWRRSVKKGGIVANEAPRKRAPAKRRRSK